ncbi:MAG TPA: hypothetical protein VN737_04385 [Bryobacteraceae bacterium]|nr:hypothetical protein [Bryobacteraceae bacterium]
MTARELITIMAENVTFPPGTASKRFVRDMAAHPVDYVLSPRAEKYVLAVEFTFRRQLPPDVRAEVESRKVEHQWVNIGGDNFLLECSVCKRTAWHKGDRIINGFCFGPPEVTIKIHAMRGTRSVCGVYAPTFGDEVTCKRCLTILAGQMKRAGKPVVEVGERMPLLDGAA